MKLFMLRNKSPPSLIVKAIERLPEGYRVTICRPRCGNFHREESVGYHEKSENSPKTISGDIMHGKVQSPAEWAAASWSSWTSSSWSTWSTTKFIGENEEGNQKRGNIRGDRINGDKTDKADQGITNNVNVEATGGNGGSGGQGFGGNVNGSGSGKGESISQASGSAIGVGVGTKPDGEDNGTRKTDENSNKTKPENPDSSIKSPTTESNEKVSLKFYIQKPVS
uniref:Uncharacterized protein n=1 Tax=Panagrolaimus sp. JU765 TaxID=591449 RepID=A0AC34QCY3_9BILA